MSDLDQALLDLTAIRRQVAETTKFRGYGPLTLLGTAVLAVAAAVAQHHWLPSSALTPIRYLVLWIATAILSAALLGSEMFARAHRIHGGIADEMLRMAFEQFLPSLAVGALLTFTLVRFVPGSVWLLPGLWQLVSALGIFASCRFLPPAMVLVGLWYALTGLLCLSLAGARALSPLAMGLPYAVGQLLMAAILLLSHRGSTHEL